ncbi:CoA-dependent acyltransferase [Punctularia strigosozonata HHB-11173 SS5]|uniref:CoA-dependent acyltransferase n=1 Tax=Punctularia strigosozonata (strain HHB-11173) TaxID=741275 RepID=UPI000441700D|nr:CoA-dependent acyltransferase [Punctularia strigosozonata HHB-11173 SS5]EIN13450.1 CoA-dependent acyltransferase [Punctularia strigosozonata HHB-11173 SS5]
MLLCRRLRPHVCWRYGRVAGCSSNFSCSAPYLSSRKVLQKFKLADIGEGITECEIVKWNLKPPATVQAFDQLCEVQSDKASVEITSPFDGVLKELLVEEGAVAKVGEGLCIIEVEEEEDSTPEPGLAKDSSSATSLSHVQYEGLATPEEKSTATHETPSFSPAESFPRRRHPLDPNYVPDHSQQPPSRRRPPANRSEVLATPAMRHLARRLGVDLTELAPGSGRDGRIERSDIDAHLARASASPSTGAAPKKGEDTIVELGRTRWGMWKAMEKSLYIPHFGYSTTLDITRLHSLLPLLNASIPEYYLPLSSTPSRPPLVSPNAFYAASPIPQTPETARYARLTYLPVFLKTLSRAMMEWPLFRSSITPAGPDDPSSSKRTMTLRPSSDISLALSTPTGLYTPTLTGVESSSVYDIASRVAHISHLGRQVPCALTPKEMPKRGGTITVSNVGAIGQGDFASPVLVPGGGVAIVAIGRAKWVWDVNSGDGSGERRLKVGVSWSADHRVVEGAELAAFVECWRGWVETPDRLIADAV